MMVVCDGVSQPMAEKSGSYDLNQQVDMTSADVVTVLAY